jgi:hypothetical protein
LVVDDPSTRYRLGPRTSPCAVLAFTSRTTRWSRRQLFRSWTELYDVVPTHQRRSSPLPWRSSQPRFRRASGHPIDRRHLQRPCRKQEPRLRRRSDRERQADVRQSYGIASLEQGTPLTPKTVFDWARSRSIHGRYR